jgi:magnesium-transporting ATPase (P-type)
MAMSLGVDLRAGSRARMAQFHFDPALRRMSTLDRYGDGEVDRVRVHTKGAPEEILPLCSALGTALGTTLGTTLGTQDGQQRPLTPDDRAAFEHL